MYTVYMAWSNAEQILVVILASALAVFLILAIVVAILAIRLLQKLHVIADKAERVVEAAGAVGNLFKKTSGTIGIFRFFQSLADLVQRKRNNKE